MDEEEPGAKGVGCSGVTGWACEQGAENRRSTAVGVSHHLEERHSQHCTGTRQQIPSIRSADGMEPYHREPMRRIRKNSTQDLRYRGDHGGDRDTPIPAQSGRDAKMIHSIASLIRGKSKLLLLESPDTVEIYKLDKPTLPSGAAGKDHVYLPAISNKTTRAASLSSIRGALSQSCPYLYDKRRGSFSSVGSQRTEDRSKKQSNLKALREAKKSNVTVTMTYLGQGHAGSRSGSTRDELKVLQQVNGGENICVFKGVVTAGEQFQFVSQRHRGFPFSATMYVNGIMAARISSCCEYRYAPGFQQGRKSCFRLTWLAGGIPCYRCTSLRNKYSSCQQLNNGTKENLTLALEQSAGNGIVASCPSSPLFIPSQPEKKLVRRRTKKHLKEGNSRSTDSEDPAALEVKDATKRKRRKGRSNQKENKGEKDERRGEEEEGRDGKGEEVSPRKPEDGASSVKRDDQTHLKASNRVKAPPRERQDISRTTKVLDSLQDGEALTKQNGERETDPGSNEKSRGGERLKDFYEECVEMSAALERGPNKQSWFKANILERCRLEKRLSSGPKATGGSDVELSEESVTAMPPDGEPGEQITAGQSASKDEPVEEEPVKDEPVKDEPVKDEPVKEEPVEEEPVKDEPVEDEPVKEEEEEEEDIQAQLHAMMRVLTTSDEVDQLVLRNTDLTDDLLLSLAGALKSSPSEVTLLNLNLNLIGPYGAFILLDLLRVKPQVKGLHLFGNKLRDHGVLALLNGIAELQEQTARAAAAAAQQTAFFPSEQNTFLHPAAAHHFTTQSSFKVFTLLELDIGGNGLNSEGLKVLAAYMRHHSYLLYLGLAQTSGADLAAWKELFDSLKGNSSLAQIILDESNLGDPGVRLLADMLKVNVSLRQVDLDRNGISDVGGNDLMGALLCRTQFPLRHLSLQENNISAGLVRRIQEEVKCN